MGISKIVILFVILGLATCGADRCDKHELLHAIGACQTSFNHYINELDVNDDMEAPCRLLETFKTCMADAVKGCGDELTWTVDRILDQLKSFDCKIPAYSSSDASSTSVANIALLIAAVATLLPFV